MVGEWRTACKIGVDWVGPAAMVGIRPLFRVEAAMVGIPGSFRARTLTVASMVGIRPLEVGRSYLVTKAP